MIASYVPASRQSLAVGIITAASYLGAVVAFALTPWLIQHRHTLSLPSPRCGDHHDCLSTGAV
eukprot:36743-Eustigmatos_ZCMA.PRE.1